MNKKLVLVFLLIVGLVGSVSAASEIYHPPNPVDILKVVAIFTVVLSLFLVTSFGKNAAMKRKKFFFLLFAVPIVLVSLYMGLHTVYENTISATKGPVHWHADYRVIACGTDLDLIDPRGLRNKIGTPLLHEHDDHRIHVEGTVLQLQDVDLGSYFEAIGGYISDTRIVYNTEDGIQEFNTGDTCPDGSVGELAVYVNGERISRPQDYLMAPEIFVPNGDCIIITFDNAAGQTTDLYCPSWEAQEYTYEMHKQKMQEMREEHSQDSNGFDRGVTG